VQYHAYDDAEPYDSVGLCRILLSSGANRDAEDNEGRTPLDYGRMCKHKHSDPLSNLLNLLNFEVPKKVKEARLNITKLQAAVTKGLQNIINSFSPVVAWHSRAKLTKVWYFISRF
jgi:hypothetical protein